MRKSTFFAVFLAAALHGASPLYASTQVECLKAIETARRFEQANKAAHAVYQQEKSEASRCAFLSKSREHMNQAARAAEICRAHEPELAEKLKADATAGLKTLASSRNTCNPKSKADLSAEKQCDDAQTAFRAKNDIFQRALADYNSNKNKQTQCAFLRTSLDYLVVEEKMLRLCEPIFEPEKPSIIPKTRARMQQVRENQARFCN